MNFLARLHFHGYPPQAHLTFIIHIEPAIARVLTAKNRQLSR
jgi:hypothetical protein